MQIHTFEAKDQATSEIAKSLNETLEKLHQENIPFLLLVSGGSAFDIFPLINTNNFNAHATIGVLDERYSTDPKVNNMAQLKETAFYQAVIAKGAKTIDTTVRDNETQEGLAKRFDNALSLWKRTNPKGKILSIIGIGPDGHTSGILPFPEDPKLFKEFFESTAKLVNAYDADGKNPYRYRVTTTNTFMRSYIDYGFVYAVGENKREALTKLFAEDGSKAETPARVLREMKNVALFTDVTL